MLFRLVPAILLASLLALVHGQTGFADLPACGQACINQVRQEPGAFGCQNGDDNACMCKSTDFQFGIRDCAQAGCAGDAFTTVTEWAASICASATAAAAPATTKLATTATPAPKSTPSPTPTLAKVESKESAAKTSLTSGATTTPTGSIAGAPSTAEGSTTASIGAEETNASQSAAASSGTATSKTTSASGTPAMDNDSANESTDQDADTNRTDAGLSIAAKAGIGVAIGVAVILLGALLICLCMRKRRSPAAKNPRSLQISDPMPGSGRSYATSHVDNSPTDLDMKSKRYEDMLPRQSPRHMV